MNPPSSPVRRLVALRPLCLHTNQTTPQLNWTSAAFQCRHYARAKREKLIVDKETLDKIVAAYGYKVPTWDDIPDWVWKFETEHTGKEPTPVTPLSGPIFKRKVNRELIKHNNAMRGSGSIKGKWRLGQ